MWQRLIYTFNRIARLCYHDRGAGTFEIEMKGTPYWYYLIYEKGENNFVSRFDQRGQTLTTQSTLWLTI